MGKSKLTMFILLSLILGVMCGWLFPSFSVKLAPLADGFLRLIKMIIAPLIFSTLVVGIAGHGNMKGIGKLGIKTLIYFEIVTTIALILGLVFANYFHPGSGVNISVSKASMNVVEQMQSSAHTVNTGNILHDTIVHLVPESVIQSMAQGNILQIVFFAVFFAIALASIGERGKNVTAFLSSIADIMFKVTEYVMYFAPIGVFAAIANTVGQNGISVLTVYAKLIGTLYLALIVFVICVLLIACKIVRIPFLSLLKVIREPALLAFSTASSEAALPKAMEIMEKFGVPKNIVSFVMPTGYTFNLDGSTLYLSFAALFVAQASGIELTLTQQIMMMLTLMLTSKGVAGVPRVSLVILTGTLGTFNIPIAAVAILLGIDQVLDMGRTTVNVIGNCVATTVVARWENSFYYDKMHAFISRNK
ncbi:MAG: cation:dicarboxylase symporter family transporter [Candidatus Gastranaerophilales bacterium]|nr:cation:dicarboxylase symporter family transporter [Candidatus Gastranaerophilales bacterium]